MNQPTDHNRQGPAANADLLGEDTRSDGTVQKPGLASTGTKPRANEPEPATGLRRQSGGDTESGEARPGLGINQAGFLKDDGAAQP